jgi:hypothetical protein
MDMLSLNKQALAKLTEGVVLLDDKGRPLSATRNSQPWLRHCIELAPALADMIAAAKTGALALPAVVELRMQGEDEQDAPEETWLVANGGAGYALLIRPRPPSESDASAGEGRFLALLGMGVRQEVAQLGAMLRAHGRAQIDAEPILRQASDLDTLLGEIGELAELHQRDEVFFEERLALPALLRDIMLELRQQRLEGGASHVLECGDTPPPGPVYGNAHWLKKALHTLLAGIEQGSPPFSSIRIHLRQLGDFIVLSAGAGNGGGAPAGQAPGARPLAAPSVQALRMRICQRVIKLHGGQLKMRLPERAPERAEGQTEAAVESFTLTLPTGVPAQDRGRLSCADCRINVQAMQYARDLAKVMQPQPLTKARLTNAHPSNAHPTN